jgi:hypothetical protein
MKLLKTGMIYIILIIIISNLVATAEKEEDDKDDVWHYVNPYYQPQTVNNQPNIDIKEIKTEIEGIKITLSMTLWPGGIFSRGQYKYASYLVFYNTSDAWYSLTYSDLDGEKPTGFALGYSKANFTPPITSGEVIINGSTISVTMDKVGENTTTTDFYGLSWVWDEYGEERYTRDHWHDWVGNYEWNPELDPGSVGDNESDKSDNNGEINDQKTSGNTPGLELTAIFSALAITYIILRRNKNHI